MNMEANIKKRKKMM